MIGSTDTDLAFSVYVDQREQDFWFAPELLEFVDHAAGTHIVIGEQATTRDEHA